MAEGVYVFKENGKEIFRSKNLITTRGSEIITSYLCGLNVQWAGAVAVGCGTSSATAIDSMLNFEYSRTPISSISPSYSYDSTKGHNRITAKFLLSQDDVCDIYEVGLYPDTSNVAAGVGQGQLLSSLSSSEPIYTFASTTGSTGPAAAVIYSGSYDETINRIGTNSIKMTTTLAASYKNTFRHSGINLDLSDYSVADTITLAGIKDTGTITKFTVRFVTDDSNYYDYIIPTITDVFDTTYKIKSYTKGLWTAYGSPSWSNITAIDFLVESASAASVILDGIRINDVDTVNPNYALISRSVLSTPIIKSAGTDMEIEYYLNLDKS